MCFLSIRIVAPGNLALTTGRATWDILRRNTFVFVRLATMEKTVKNYVNGDVIIEIQSFLWYSCFLKRSS